MRDRLIALPLALILMAACSPVCQAQQDKFSQWDSNADGRLTRDELPSQLRKNFDRVDTDGDGFISPEEDAAVRNRSQRNRQQSGRQARGVPEGIVAKRDIPYAGTDNARQRLDLYLPEKPSNGALLPVVVWIHGGGWRSGDKAGGISRVAELVASGHYAGVSVGYRLSAEAIWPAQIHDCKAAIRWIRANARQHNLDPSRIGVWGSSAGGHLVAMLGVSGDVQALEGTLGGHTDQSSRVQCVADYFGPSDLLTMDDFESNIIHNAPDSPESRLIGGPIQKNKEATRAASPIAYVSKDDPPILIVHGTRDLAVPFNQSEILTAKLKELGVDVTFVAVENAGHGRFPTAEPEKRVRTFFNKHLRGLSVEVEGQAIPANTP